MRETRTVREPADGEPGLRVIDLGDDVSIEHYYPGGSGKGRRVDREDVPGLRDALDDIAATEEGDADA